MQMTVAQRITLAVGVALASLLLIGVYGLWNLYASQTRFEYVQDNTIPSVQTVNAVAVATDGLRVSMRDLLLADTDAQRRAALKKIDEVKQSIDTNFAKYEKDYISDETDKKLLEASKAYYLDYVKAQGDFFARVQDNDIQGAKQLLGEGSKLRTIGNQWRKAMSEHIDYNQKLADALRASNKRDYARAFWIQVVVIAGAFAFSCYLGILVIREIRQRLARLSSLMMRVNETLDFTTRIPVARLDEVGSSADAFNKLLDKMQDNLKAIAARALEVATAANALAETSGHVATAAHQQSESSSDIAATVEQMTVSVNHVADRAQDANRLSSESGELAASGVLTINQTTSDIQNISATVNEAAELIKGLEQSSQEIANVIQVIKEIADQTNLLALNAAIEAARAGEQGRGFAVVADEVRKLAERTTTSTQEIASTIDNMRHSASAAASSIHGVVDKVGVGVEGANRANEAIHQIGEGSSTAVGMVREIADAIREQGLATTNIAKQIERIAQMSEQSSAAAGNSAESAKHLDRVAKEMQSIVGAYRL